MADASAPYKPSAEEVQWHGLAAQPHWARPKVIAKSADDARPGYNTFSASEYRDDPTTLKEKVKVVAALLKKSQATVMYTGAGISTAAGVPDYASKASGSIAPHRRSGNADAGNRLNAMPTYAHHFIAALEEKGLAHHWVQQNHDRLGQKAGYPQEKLNEIHGAWGDHKNPVVQMDGTLRPDLLEWLVQWVDKAELCIAMGTSMCGMNADQIPMSCAERHMAGDTRSLGAVIINLQQTPVDSQCTVRIWGLLDDVLMLLAKELKMKVPSRAAAQRGNEWVASHPACRYNTPKRKPTDPL